MQTQSSLLKTITLKLSLLLILTVLLNLNSISQTSRSSNDSITCIPNYQLRNAAIWIENGKLAVIERDVARDSLKLTLRRISLKDSIILTYKFQESTFNGLITSYKKEIEVLNRSSNLAIDMYAKQKKLYNRQRVKSKFAIITTAILASSITYLITK